MVAAGDGLALGDLLVEAVELGEDDGALQGVHAAADADAGVDVTFALAMDADLAAGLGQGVVAGEDRAAVAVAAQGFAGEEAGAAQGAEVATLTAPVGGAEALGGVFDHRKVAVAGGDGVDRVHVCRLAVEANGHDGLGAGTDLGLDQGGVDVAGVRFDVDEHWGGADQDDDLGGGDEGERGGDDLVAGAYPQGHQADEQGLGAAGDGDAVLGAGIGGQAVFQFPHLGAEDVLAVVEDAVEIALQLGAEGVLLGLEIDEVDLLIGLTQPAIGIGLDGFVGVFGQQAFVAGQELDSAGSEAVQSADELRVLGVWAIEDRAFRGQGGEPLFVFDEFAQ